MGKKWLKGLIWGLGGISLLFGLFYCMENNKAVSLTKSDKDKFTKSEKDKLTTARSLGQAFVEVAKKVQPAVVNITTEKTVTLKPWERFGEDFFKGSPFEDFFRGFGYSPREIEIVESLIMVTTMPQAANTKLEKVICDADLDALGREDFFITSFQLQLEWKLYGIMNCTLAEWIRFEIDFMEKHHYFTSSAIQLREKQKQKNIKAFKDLLKNGR